MALGKTNVILDIFDTLLGILDKISLPLYLYWRIYKGKLNDCSALQYNVVKFDCAGAVVSRGIGFHHLHQSWFRCITLDEVLSFRKKSISSAPYSVKFASPYIKLLLEFLHIPG